MEHKITTENILAAAAKCSTAKETLKTLFPEAFEDDKYFDFERKHVIDTLERVGNPFYIGEGNAPDNYRSKCLIVNDDWDIEIQEYDGRKIIIPFKKQP